MLMTMRVQESRVLEICTHGLTRGTGETPSLLYCSLAATPVFGSSLNSEMETATDSGMPVIAARHKTVLKHSQSKRWREVRGVPANATPLATFQSPVKNRVKMHPANSTPNLGVIVSFVSGYGGAEIRMLAFLNT